MRSRTGKSRVSTTRISAAKSFISENWKLALFYLLGLITTKSCDLAVDWYKAPDKSFKVVASVCSEGDVLDKDSGRRSWVCPVEFRNKTGDANTLKIACKTDQGNFMNPVKIESRGGGEAALYAKVCFDESQNDERACDQMFQKNEFLKIKFEVAAYEKPTISCSSDSL